MSDVRVPRGRLFVALAREAPVGVIFRRGPSKWVEVIRWDTSADTFERGHWFHGRIYETSMDLSPDGSLLVYFAAKWNSRTLRDRDVGYAWTAISKPPWLTALALWPMHICIPGGGLFWDRNTLWLNHSPGAMPHRDHKPHGLGILIPSEPKPGEDITVARLHLNGWRRTKEAGEWERPSPDGVWSLVMEWAVSPADGARYWDRVGALYHPRDYRLRRIGSEIPLPLAAAEWADWDHRGRLVFSHGGKLFAGEPSTVGEVLPQELADFTDDKPEEYKPPEWARKW
jgi:hypothetical protein